MNFSEHNSIKAVAYARVSSKEQEREGFSIPAQTKLLKKYAAENGFEIVKTFEESESARTTGRQEFRQMIEFVTDPSSNCNTILVEKTDRLYRNPKDWVILDEIDVNIHLVKEGEVIASDAHSSKKFLHGIRVLMAKQYIDNLSEEVKKGMREKAEQGRYPGGNIPYGYLLDKNTGDIKPDPQRAHHIKAIFELYAANKMSLRALVSWARSSGLTTPRSGKPITMCQIERILKNPFYYGAFQWAGKLYQGSHEPIISRQLFEDTQRAFKIHNRPQLHRKHFAFGNLMICSKCGAKVTAEIKKGKYVYYHCTGMKPGGCDLVYVKEAQVVGQFADMLGPITLTDRQADKIMSRLSKRQAVSGKCVDAERQRVALRLGQIKKWAEQAYQDKLESTITAGHWKTLSDKWETEQINLQSQLEALNGKGPDILFTAERVLELSQKLPGLWLSRNNDEKRELVDMLYWNCTLDGATLSAAYKKPFSILAEGTQTQQWRG